MIKKITLLITIVGALAIKGNAQEIGLRFGNGILNNIAIDGVFETSDAARIHADVSFGPGVGVAVLYDFINRPLEGDLTWYLGVGGSAIVGNNFFALGVPAEIGLEYHFDAAPIALGVDWRPTLFIVENTSLDANSFGFNVRYVLP